MVVPAALVFILFASYVLEASLARQEVAVFTRGSTIAAATARSTLPWSCNFTRDAFTGRSQVSQTAQVSCDQTGAERGLSREQPIWDLMRDAASPWDEILRDVRPRGRLMDMRGDGQGTLTMTNMMQSQGPVNSDQTYLYPLNELFTHSDRPFQRGHDQVIWEELNLHPTYLLFPNVFPSR